MSKAFAFQGLSSVSIPSQIIQKRSISFLAHIILNLSQTIFLFLSRFLFVWMWALVSNLGEWVAPSVVSPSETVRVQWMAIRRFVIDQVPEIGKGQVRREKEGESVRMRRDERREREKRERGGRWRY